MSLGEDVDHDNFQLTIKNVEKMDEAELTDEFAKEQSNGEAKNVDEFKSYIKSRMQQYYDQSAKDMFRQDAVDALAKAHDFDIPEVMVNQIQDSYVDYAKQQSGGQLPPNFDEDEYKENSKIRQYVKENGRLSARNFRKSSTILKLHLKILMSLSGWNQPGTVCPSIR